jgi:lipoyl(octanoyl) transferase
MQRQRVVFKDLLQMDYQQAWDYQESLLQENVLVKTLLRKAADKPVFSTTPENLPDNGLYAFAESISGNDQSFSACSNPSTTNYLLFVEHPPVYTLGKSGDMNHVLINEGEMSRRNIGFYKINRGGDITFHGPGQVVGYPVLDLEKFFTDIGKYLRNLEEVIILTLQEYGLKGERSAGETGVWIDAGKKGKERKICAIGVRCSRWITMHGFAFNVNTDLSYFNDIIPCGIADKQVTSLAKELGNALDMDEVKEKVRRNFGLVFNCEFYG